MERLEVARGEALALEQRDGEAVAERELHDGRGGGREAVRAGFLGARQVKHDVGAGPSVLSAREVIAISGTAKRRE